MRYMFIMKSTGHHEAGIPHRMEHIRAVAAFRQSLAEAGILVAAEELLPSSSGARITYSANIDQPRLQSGPFPALGGSIAEYMIINVASEAAALDWALRIPVPAGLGEFEIELRQLKDRNKATYEPMEHALQYDLHNHLHMFNNRDNS
ncbi:YciI family protein [Paenibacillus sp. strain BS8-2]